MTTANPTYSINLILLQSDLVGHANAKAIHKDMIEALEQNFQVNYFNDNEAVEAQQAEGLTIIWVASGGTEEKFQQLYGSLTESIYLLNDGISNSLAASLEIASWLRRKAHTDFHVIHNTAEGIVEEVAQYSAVSEAKSKLNGQRIGVIGEPSDWLIASSVNPTLAKEKWGVEFVDINLQEVLTQYDAILEDAERLEDATLMSQQFITSAIEQVEGDVQEVHKAVCLYLALKDVCLAHNLQALTLRCFGLIDHTKTTGCLALAWLNRDGIIAGCEGDMQSILSLVVAKAVTGQTGFMANPSIIDKASNQVVLSHCMVDPSLTESYVIRSHYETLSGIALQGLLPVGKVTIFKMGGAQLDEAFITAATLEENTKYGHFCRTQARFTLEESVSYFLERPIGNHHIILWGNHAEILKRLLKTNK